MGLRLHGSARQLNSGESHRHECRGTAALGNTLDGISLNNASSNSIIGNVVSGNGINQDAAGINLESNDRNNIIAGNKIGTNAAGNAALGNSLHGIFLGNGSSNNTIGGPTDNDRNVISGNGKFPVADSSPPRGAWGSTSSVRTRRATSCWATTSAPTPPASPRWPTRSSGC